MVVDNNSGLPFLTLRSSATSALNRFGCGPAALCQSVAKNYSLFSLLNGMTNFTTNPFFSEFPNSN